MVFEYIAKKDILAPMKSNTTNEPTTEQLSAYLEKGDFETYFKHANSLWEKKDYDAYLSVLLLGEKFPEVQHKLAIFYLEDRLPSFNEEKAFSYFELALQNKFLPALFDYFYNLQSKKDKDTYAAKIKELENILLQEKYVWYIRFKVSILAEQERYTDAVTFLKNLPDEIPHIIYTANVLSNFPSNESNKWDQQSFNLLSITLDRFSQNTATDPKELGDILIALGWRYLHGFGGVEKDINEALVCGMKALEKGNLAAHILLSRVATHSEQYQKAVEHLEQAIQAEVADDSDYFTIASIYSGGYLGQEDREKSLFWLRKAFEKKPSLENIQRLSRALIHEKDQDKMIEAFNLVKNHVEQFPQLYELLGDFYREGWGTEKDQHAAVKAYDIALVHFQDADACLGIAIIYARSKEFLEMRKMASRAFERAIELGSQRAITLYADHLYDIGEYEKCFNILNTFKDPEDDLCWYTHMGKLYQHGYGVALDTKKAKEYFEKSHNDDPYCHCGTRALGVLYYYGIDGVIDYAKAKEYFELANQKVEHAGDVPLGYLYAKGLGVEKADLKKAYELFSSRKKNTDDEAADFNLGVMYLYGLYAEQDEQVAKQLFDSAQKQALANNNKVILGALEGKPELVFPYE